MEFLQLDLQVAMHGEAHSLERHGMRESVVADARERRIEERHVKRHRFKVAKLLAVVRHLYLRRARHVPVIREGNAPRKACRRDLFRSRHDRNVSIDGLHFRRNPVVDALHREHGNVCVESIVVHATRQNCVKTHWPFHGRFRVRREFHRLRRRHPRSARVRPSRAVRHAQHEAQPLRLLRGMAEAVEIFMCTERDRTHRSVAAGIKHHRAGEAVACKRFKIGGYPLLRDVAVHPVPPDVWRVHARWIGKCLRRDVGGIRR